MIGPYATPHAFRSALETRLRQTAQRQGIDLQRLQRRVAFERLLARLFSQDDPPWFLKGGYALELRLQHRARSTLDLDLSVPDPEWLQTSPAAGDKRLDAALLHAHLQEVAERDLGDGFTFLIRPPRGERGGVPGGGARCSVEARLAGRTFARFRLDVGLGDAMLGPPEWVKGSPLLHFARIPPARIALCPVEQQFAEKIHAYTFPWEDRDNTRVKDLVDLVLLAESGLLVPEHVEKALRVTFMTRGTHPLPSILPKPPPDWIESFAALAEELELPTSTLQKAYSYMDTFWQKWSPSQAQSCSPCAQCQDAKRAGKNKSEKEE